MNIFKQNEILTLGFGTTVLMWAIGYFCRLPVIFIPSQILFSLLLLSLLFGGFIAGLTTSYGWKAGVYTGLLTAFLNLLVLGGLISNTSSTNQVVPSALWWIPGSFATSAILGGIGSILSSATKWQRSTRTNWTNALAWIAVAATFQLLVIGGMVTGYEAGLAVVDWPNSFGYNMFLYPLSRMTGGIYFEHAHRLFGSLVGLTTVVLAIHLFLTESRKWIRQLGVTCVILVIIQGILGGLRVTGYFTFSTSIEETAPSIILAIVHGVFGQVFFSILVALALFTSTPWKNSSLFPQSPTIDTDHTLGKFLVILVIAQLLIGAVLRHIFIGLHLHLTLAIVVIAVAVTCGSRTLGLYGAYTHLKHLGFSLLALISIQLFLGISALVATGITKAAHSTPSEIEVAITTAHQATGAIILANAVLLMLCYHRQWRQ